MSAEERLAEVAEEIKTEWYANHRGAPPLVTLCGSTRFKELFIKANSVLTEHGIMVLSVGWFDQHGPAEDKTNIEQDRKIRLDKLHKEKIDASNAVLVLNEGGYIGDSTRGEVKHARTKGRRVYWFQQLPKPVHQIVNDYMMLFAQYGDPASWIRGPESDGGSSFTIGGMELADHSAQINIKGPVTLTGADVGSGVTEAPAHTRTNDARDIRLYAGAGAPVLARLRCWDACQNGHTYAGDRGCVMAQREPGREERTGR